jgi:hypothetical protein
MQGCFPLHGRDTALEAKAQVAELSHEQFARLERIEKELGVSPVAYRATDYDQIANVPEPTLQRVQALERNAGGATWNSR